MQFLANHDPLEAMPFLKQVLSFTGLGWPHRILWKFVLTLLLPWVVILAPMVWYGFPNNLDSTLRGYSELIMFFNIDIRVLIFAWKQAEFEELLTILQNVLNKVRTTGAKNLEFKMVSVANQALNKSAKAYMTYIMAMQIMFIIMPGLQTTAIYFLNRRNATSQLDFVTMTEIQFYELDNHRNILHYMIYYVCAFPSHCCLGFKYALSGVITYCSIKSIIMMFELVTQKLDKIHELSGEELREQFSEIVALHADGLRCINIFERISNMMVLVQMIYTGLIWISLILCLSNHPTLNSINLTVLLIVVTSETFAFCKLGTQLSEMSLAVGQSAYESQWYDLPLTVQKGLALVQTRAQKWEGLTAARFYPLSIEQFGAMVQTSYSVFVVLKERLQGVA